jgi:hypothetical protein
VALTLAPRLIHTQTIEQEMTDATDQTAHEPGDGADHGKRVAVTLVCAEL